MAKNATDIEMPKNAGWTFEEYTATITTTTLPGVFTAAITFDKTFAATPRRTYAYVGGTYDRVAKGKGADNLSTTGAVAYVRGDTTGQLPDGTVTVTVCFHGRFV